MDTEAGKETAERFRLETPRPATPDAVAERVGEVAKHFDWTGPVGVTFPGVVMHGTIHTAANLEPDWIGVDAIKLFGGVLGGAGGDKASALHVLNDA
ncbi:MAG: ROK family protein, partial [Actinocrinis sp.]